MHRILKEVLNRAQARHSESSHRQGKARPRAAASTWADEDHQPSPWSKRRERKEVGDGKKHLIEVIPLDELHDIAVDSSTTERRADEAERELIEWKKIKFMEDKVGEDFSALLVSVTKYGLFVELDDLFVEGLVPISENTRQIIGERSGHAYSIGGRIRVIIDRIDRVQRKLQFSILEEQSRGPNTKGSKAHAKSRS